MADLFDQLYTTIDYRHGISPWDIAESAIEQGATPWYDPRFVKAFHELLFACFQDTAYWLKGKTYTQLILDQMPAGIDDDLITIARALQDGRLPEVDSWNAGNPFACPWPAPITRYCYPWNGHMLQWALAEKANRRLARRLKLKASGYQSPRRQIYSP